MNLTKMSLFGLVVVVIATVWYMRKDVAVLSDDCTTIGILQTASHPALDAARDGFMQGLKAKMGSKVDFVVQNAQGSIASAHMIAQRFHNNANICATYAIATPAAQALVMVEQDKPIFIAAVTDSTVLGHHENLCGVSDMIDMYQEMKMIQLFFPHARTVAVIYNNAELNSLSQLDQIKKELLNFNLEIVEVGISQESDLSSAVAMACRKADVLLCPTDSMIASTINLVATIASQHHKPLFVCDNLLVQYGALAACGIDYVEIGKDVAEIAFNVLINHNSCSDFGVKKAKIKNIYVNQRLLQDFGLTVPQELQEDVVLVA